MLEAPAITILNAQPAEEMQAQDRPVAPPAEAERPRRVGGGEGEWLLWLAARILELGFSVRTGRCASAGCTPLPASCRPSLPLASSAAEPFSAAAASAARWCAQRPPPRPRPPR